MRCGPVDVLARNRTWSPTFAGSCAVPAHSEDVISNRPDHPPPGNRTRPCGFEDRRAPDTLAGRSDALARSRTWSATFGGSRALPSHSKGEPRDDTASRDARIRTLSASFGDSLLSQEHIPFRFWFRMGRARLLPSRAPPQGRLGRSLALSGTILDEPILRDQGYSAGVEPGASRFTFSRASVTPRTPSKGRPRRGGRSGRGGSRTRKAVRSPALQAGPVSGRVALPYRGTSRGAPSGPGWTRTTDLPHVKGTSWPLDDGTRSTRRRRQCPGQDSNPEHLVRSEG